jgi:predicted house-cleaning NTP pyrophosphatase (Maf/HAM1 superfamily)
MRPYSPREVAAYVAGGSPLDKAGAYGIQDDGFLPVDLERLTGCYANVMGLPLCHLARALRRLGHPSPADVPAGCRAHTGYDCPVYESILRETE